MNQLSFSDAEFVGKRKVTRREKFLAEMERAIPWKVFAALVEPHYPKAGNGRRPYPLEVMLRIHFMQQWFNLSDPAMEEALYDSTSIRRFAKLSLARGSIPDETTILNFRHLLEHHDIAADALEAVNLLLADQGMMVRKGTIADRNDHRGTQLHQERDRHARPRDTPGQEGQSVALWHEGPHRRGHDWHRAYRDWHGGQRERCDPRRTLCCMVRRSWRWAMRATRGLRSGKRIWGAMSGGILPCARASVGCWAEAIWAGYWNPTSGPRPVFGLGWSIRCG